MIFNPIERSARFVRRLGILAAFMPFALGAQQVVFNDTFATSTFNGASTNKGSATVSSTSYDVASGKNCTQQSISSGHFGLECASTSAGYVEAQAVFSRVPFTPITLQTAGDTIDIQMVFTDTTNIFNGKATSGASLALGLFSSSGVLPVSIPTTGTNLWNGGLSSSKTDSTTGGVQNWVGYRGNVVYAPGVSANSVIYSRPTQNQGNNLNQTLVQQGSGGFSGGANVGQKGNTIAALTVGQQYTVDFNITLAADGSLLFTNNLYAGVGTGGTLLATNNGTATGANILTTNFDSFVVGGERTGSVQTTNDINQIIITATLAAQAGPYFNVTGGSGCGGIDIGLDGSVTTNSYWLYTNGVNSGVSIAGTGSAIDFGIQTSPAVYTVVASNSVTSSMGPMFGYAVVTAGAPVFNSQPVSAVAVTNALASFSANVSGVSLAFQWYKGAAPLTNGGDIAGANTTNLVISPAQAADAAPTPVTLANGYYLVVTNSCGFAVTSSPVALDLIPARNLVWRGGNPDNTWDLGTTANFLNTADSTLEVFTNGDYVTFDDTSANTAVSIVGNPTITTLATVTGSQSWNFGGTGTLGGASVLVVSGSASLTLTNAHSFTGGTTITNSATLNIGDGTRNGADPGKINVNTGSTLHYFAPGSSDVTLRTTALSGSGTVVYEINNNSRTVNLDTTFTNQNFGGTVDIKAGTRLQMTSTNGFGGTNYIVEESPSFSGSLYLNTAVTSPAALSLSGRGPASPVDTPQGFGALRLGAGATWAGPITITGVDPSYNVTTIGAGNASGTIRGNITDNGSGYELEYYGGTINVGPTTGVNTYGDTRITEQVNSGLISVSTTVVALNSNAFSTNVLHMNGWTVLRLNGNNLAFNNLVDESAGGIGYNGAYSNIAPAIVNGSTNATATITVGRDDGSRTFYGKFGDGGSRSLGLTKVGAGTLTLTGDSTNTGPVTVAGGTLALAQSSASFWDNGNLTFPIIGSGSFSNAAMIDISSGATLDVSGRTDQTLTLNSGQTLKGDGTVAGNLVTTAGSTINPGESIGTLSITGTATLAGTLLLELNRTNTPASNDTIVVSGTFTPGGILAVTNIGPVLQVGDSFQLFASGTSGFAYALQTNDVANNVQYTWNNTVATDGKVTVASVGPLVNTTPTNIVTSISGSNLTLSWPADHTGWRLQTNAVGLTTTNAWFDYPGSSATNQISIGIDQTKTNVFFRMIY